MCGSNRQVLRICHALRKKGVKVWMDLDHMKTDIYDSMAEGVQGAACMVCCMSPAY